LSKIYTVSSTTSKAGTIGYVELFYLTDIPSNCVLIAPFGCRSKLDGGRYAYIAPYDVNNALCDRWGINSPTAEDYWCVFIYFLHV